MVSPVSVTVIVAADAVAARARLRVSVRGRGRGRGRGRVRVIAVGFVRMRTRAFMNKLQVLHSSRLERASKRNRSADGTAFLLPLGDTATERRSYRTMGLRRATRNPAACSVRENRRKSYRPGLY